jgi:hypothetical protein
MMEELQFNFHDLVGVRVMTDDRRARDFYLQEFKRAVGGTSPDTPAVNLTWQRKSAHERIPSGYQSHVHKLLARWGYKIRIEDRSIQISAMGNSLALPMVHHMLVQPSIRFLCSMQGVLMLHGSAVVHVGKSIIFTGSGGAGKTTSSSLILNSGGSDWQMHADDYLFVDGEMYTKGFLTRAHLYRAILEWIPEKKGVLTAGERMRLEFFGRLRSLTNDGLKWPLRVSEDRLWPKHSWAESADLGVVILLRKGTTEVIELTPAVNKDGLVEDLLEMNFNEARHFCMLVEKPGDAGVASNWLDQWKQRERQLIEAILLAKPIYWLDLPTHPEADRMGRELVDMLTNLINSQGVLS